MDDNNILEECPYTSCEGKRLKAENAKLNIILFHRENGLDHPDLQVEIDKSKFAELQAEFDKYKANNVSVAEILSDSEGMANDIEDMEEDAAKLKAENGLLVELLKLAYRNWLEDPDVAWGELGEKLCDGLCEAMGDVEYQKWMEALKGGT